MPNFKELIDTACVIIFAFVLLGFVAGGIIGLLWVVFQLDVTFVVTACSIVVLAACIRGYFVMKHHGIL